MSKTTVSIATLVSTVRQVGNVDATIASKTGLNTSILATVLLIFQPPSGSLFFHESNQTKTE